MTKLLAFTSWLFPLCILSLLWLNLFLTKDFLAFIHTQSKWKTWGTKDYSVPLHYISFYPVFLLVLLLLIMFLLILQFCHFFGCLITTHPLDSISNNISSESNYIIPSYYICWWHCVALYYNSSYDLMLHLYKYLNYDLSSLLEI